MDGETAERERLGVLVGCVGGEGMMVMVMEWRKWARMESGSNSISVHC